MSIIELFMKVVLKVLEIFKELIFQKPRIFKYQILSNCKSIIGKPICHSPLLINGLGKIFFGKEVNLGVKYSPFFYSTYIYIEARNIDSQIIIESGVWINNNSTIICDGAGIFIGNNTIIGSNFTVYDSDFHNVTSLNRFDGKHKKAPVSIHSNVFIGSNVTILKGVTIGENSVIANGSVVTKSIPRNSVAGGNPCKVIKNINFSEIEIG